MHTSDPQLKYQLKCFLGFSTSGPKNVLNYYMHFVTCYAVGINQKEVVLKRVTGVHFFQNNGLQSFYYDSETNRYVIIVIIGITRFVKSRFL